MHEEKQMNHTEQLPYEVLTKIFDSLDAENVKSCSLVCRRWKEVIFSDNYIKRFKLCLDPSGLLGGSIQCKKEVLELSDRFYRHVVFILLNTSLQQMCDKIVSFDILYTILSYPKVEQLVSVTLVIALHDEFSKRVADAVKDMKMLQELRINGSFYYESCYVCNTMKIESNSLKQLALDKITPVCMITPNLEELEVDEHDDRLYAYRLHKLKKITITRHQEQNSINSGSVEEQILFFHRLHYLETVTLHGEPVPGYWFKVICEQCPTLTELSIDSLIIIEMSTMSALSNLGNLRCLTFKNIISLNPVSFSSVELPQLESFGLGHFPALHDTLKAFASATKLIIYGTTFSSTEILAIVRALPNVRNVSFRAL